VTGPTGATGATGPAATSVYGSKYQDTANTLDLTANTPTEVTLGQNGANSSVDVSMANSLKITETGVYLINYQFTGSPSNANTLTIAVANNNTNLAGTVTQKTLAQNEELSISKSIVTPLNNGDVVTLTITSTDATTISFGDTLNAYLSVVAI